MESHSVPTQAGWKNFNLLGLVPRTDPARRSALPSKLVYKSTFVNIDLFGFRCWRFPQTGSWAGRLPVRLIILVEPLKPLGLAVLCACVPGTMYTTYAPYCVGAVNFFFLS